MMPFEVTERTTSNSIVTYWATSESQKARLAFIVEANWFKIEIGYVSSIHGKVDLLVTMESKKELRNFLEVVGARQPFTRSCCATMLLKHNDQHVIIAHIEPGAMEEWVKECGEILAALPLREKLVESGMIHLL
ncbi:hypothetical protein KBC03_08305 [Patescibacteria group bacterium]|nr:hypothetical protein [Patescibacteria group bacterium]